MCVFVGGGRGRGGRGTDSCRRIPADWRSVQPAHRRVVSRSAGTPSARLGEEASCSAVARGLQRRETMVYEVLRMVVVGLSRVVVSSRFGDVVRLCGILVVGVDMHIHEISLAWTRGGWVCELHAIVGGCWLCGNVVKLGIRMLIC